MVRAGADLVRGLVRGLKNSAGQVVRAVKDIASRALSSILSFFGINSPSRVFAGIGKSLCDGLVVGLNDGASDVIKAACNILKRQEVGEYVQT